MNNEPLFSTHWHHVKDIRAQLADDIETTRHVYRGRVSWVLYRYASRGSFRLDPASFELIERMDGQITVGQIWEQAILQHDQSAPTQDAWLQLLADLHAADLLTVHSRIPVETLFERRQDKQSREQRQRFLNPLYMRFTLFDPDEWLDRLPSLTSFMFSRSAFVLLTLLISISVLVLFSNSERLINDMANVAQLNPYIASLFLFVYPVLKLAHELGHALAVKRFGGGVHEMGIALLVGFPLPFVDASASSVLKSKAERMLVVAAGIIVELAVAAIGALLWAHSSGVASDLGLVLLVSGGISTFVFNGNPLLKFDGYYLLADWLEIPNLQIRSRRAVNQMLRRVLAGASVAKSRSEDAREWRWLCGYGICSSVYRTVLMLWIAWFVSDRWALLGVALAGFALFMGIVLPSCRGIKALFNEEQLQSVRARVLAVGAPLVVVIFLALLPMPHSSVTRGVVWLPEEAIVRVSGVCEVVEVVAKPETHVQAGDELFECANVQLTAQERHAKARVAELNARLRGAARKDEVEYSIRKAELKAEQDRLTDIQKWLDAEHHRARVDGQFSVSGTTTLLGRAYSRGEIAAYTIPATGRTIRLAFQESQFAYIDQFVDRIEVRVKHKDMSERVYSTSIRHRSPRASMEVPTAGLSSIGGGPHPADPSGDGRLLTYSVMDIELNWPTQVDAASIGEHVDVRFVHSPKPLIGRFIKNVRRAFMSRQAV